MKNKNVRIRILSLCMVCIIALFACMLSACSAEIETPQASTNATVDTTSKAASVWDNAVYTEDTSFGNGATKITVDVVCEDEKVTFTINTDAETLADALLEHELIDGDMGDFGIYIKTVNGILADYDIDASYWCLMIGDTMASTGADGIELVADGHYQLVYTK